MKGNFSTNYQNAGRELLTPDEVRLLDNRYAVLLIRGEKPIIDLKYDIIKHPNLALTADGDKNNAYEHGQKPKESVKVEIVDITQYPSKKMSDFTTLEEYLKDLEIFDDADLEDYLYYQNKENNNEVKQNEKQ